MKVIYTDPSGAAGTYHPKLGYLESGKPFDLPGDVAGKYIKSGLLKKYHVIPAKAGIQKDKNKNSAFAPLREEKEEVKEDGESIDR